MINRIPRGFSIFTRKNARSYVSLSVPYIGPLLSRGYQTVAMMNLKYILFLNASAKDRDARGTPCHLVLMSSCLTSHVLALSSQLMFC